MWIIIAKDGLSNHREDVLSDILDQEVKSKPDLFIMKKGNKYATTRNLSDAQFYKLEVSCKKLLQRFSKSKSLEVVPYWDKFYWVKEFHLTYRKVDKTEWNQMCDKDVEILTKSYEHQKSLIEKRRRSFK